MFQASAAIFASLLIATGFAKSIRPTDTAIALRELGIGGGVAAVRVLSWVEIGVGVWVLATMDKPALLAQSVIYGIFAMWVWMAIRLDAPLASCGCLGRDDTPPYWGHIAVNAAAVLVSLGGLLGDAGWPSYDPIGYATVAVVMGVGVGLAWQILGVGARVAPLVNQ